MTDVPIARVSNAAELEKFKERLIEVDTISSLIFCHDRVVSAVLKVRALRANRIKEEIRRKDYEIRFCECLLTLLRKTSFVGTVSRFRQMQALVFAGAWHRKSNASVGKLAADVRQRIVLLVLY